MTAEIRFDAVLSDSSLRESDFPSTLDSQLAHPPDSKQARKGTALLPTLPGYEIISELGRAGMGVVFKAWQIKENRPVAIKMLRDGAFAGAEQFERFYNEAQILSNLHHPNIIQIYEIGEQNGRLYMVLQFAEGGCLSDYLSEVRFPIEEALCLIEILARATHFVHEHGILHRDLKPANILIKILEKEPNDPEVATRRVLPMIADFGLGKRAESRSNTTTGAILGTPSYMSPEQARGERQIDQTTDVYSLGAILYELLTGYPPFRGETILATLDLVRAEMPTPPSELSREISPEIEAVCMKCLAKKPADRYASALELAEEIQCIIQKKPLQRTLIQVQRDEEQIKLIEHHVEKGMVHARAMELSKAFLWFAKALAECTSAGSRGPSIHRNRIQQVLRHCPRLTRIWAWGERVTQATFCSDGLSGVCALEGGSLYLLDLATGDSTPFQDSHQGNINQLTFNRDGKALVTVSDDNTARVWDVATGEALSLALSHRQWVTSASFSPCGEKIVTTCADGTVWLWDWRQGQPLLKPCNHGGMLWSACFSPDGQTIVSTGWDGCARLWSTQTGEPVKADIKHANWIRHSCFSADGELLATASDDHTARVWTRQGEPVTLPLRHDDAVRHVELTSDGSRLLTWTVSNQLHAWDVATGKPIEIHPRLALKAADDSCSSDGRRFLQATSSGALYLFDRFSCAEEELQASLLTDESMVKSSDEDLSEWTTLELQGLAQIYSGKRVGEHLTLESLGAEELSGLWQFLESQHPDFFTAPASASQLWHIRALERCSEYGFHEQALTHLHLLLEQDPTQSRWWASRGKLHLQMGDQDRALADYDRAVTLDEHEPAWRLARGILLEKLGLWEEASQDFKHLTRLRPEWNIAHERLARAHLRLQKYDRAVARLSVVINRQPRNRKLYLLRGNVLAQCHQWGRAAEDFAQAQSLGENRSITLALHALICLRQGDELEHQRLRSQLLSRAESTGGLVDSAWAAWVATLSDSPEHAELALCMAERCQALQEEEFASVDFLCTLKAAALHRAGRSEEAALLLYSQEEGGSIQSQLWLTIISASLGRKKQGLDLFRKALRWLKSQDQGASGLSSLPWHQKVEIHLLRQEAGRLLETMSHSAH